MNKKRRLWMLLGVVTLLLGAVLRRHPGITETIYGTGLYPAIRWVLSHTLSFLPIPAITMLLIVGIWWFWKTVVIPIRRRNWTLRSMIWGILATAGAALFLFQFLWGFNYARPAWDERLDIRISGMTASQLEEEYQRATLELIDASAVIGNVESLTTKTNRAHENAIRPLVKRILREHDFPVSANPRVRIVKPRGILMRWNTAGIYVPYSGEGHVDAGMLPVQIPFTLAHEMAHGFGVTDEGDCNFIAYLACRGSDDPEIRFAGILSYWRYVASEYRLMFPEEYKNGFDDLPQIVKQLLAEIRANDAKYPDLLPQLRNKVYDTYLKSQGIHDGLYSYSRVVQLVWAYGKKGEGINGSRDQE